MKSFTFKKNVFLILFMLLCSVTSVYADNDGLITQQITIKLDHAGMLPSKIGSTKKFQITNLKLIGDINGDDVSLIREMAGCDYHGEKTKGNLSILDLSEANIVSGGSGYIYYYYYTYKEGYKYEFSTHDDEIGVNFFYGCDKLSNVILPSSIKDIKDFAFEGCSSLISLALPPNMVKIYGRTFKGCSSLTSLTFPPSLQEIGFESFYGCSGLVSLTLPSSLIRIRDGAFKNCSGLKSIYVYSDLSQSMGSNVFDGCNASGCTVYVPKGTYQDYWLSEFGYFDNIVEFDATGVDAVSTNNDVKEVSRYTVDGQQLSAPTKGLNIVKYSDGTTRKVMVP